MAHSPANIWSGIQEYATEAREVHDQQMELDASRTEAHLHQTIQDLHTRIEEQRAALEKARRHLLALQKVH